MILTCPKCASRYFLPDLQVGPAGRVVKCAQCKTTWRAHPQSGQAGEPAPEPPGLDPNPLEAFPDPEAEFALAAQRRSEILRDQKAAAERKARQSAMVGASVWAGLAAAVVLVLVMAVVFRAKAVELWPGTASAYAAIGLPVNASGLLIDKVEATPLVLGSQRVVRVVGVVTNATGSPRPVPGFRVSIQDRAGKTLKQNTISISAPPIKVGEARRFSLTVADPPSGYDAVEVTLAPPDAPAPAPARPALPPAAPAAAAAPAAPIAPRPVPTPVPTAAPVAKTGAP